MLTFLRLIGDLFALARLNRRIDELEDVILHMNADAYRGRWRR